MEIPPCEVLTAILNRLINWKPGDIRPITMHIQPCQCQGKLQVQMTWDDTMIECCRTAFEQCRIPRHRTMADVEQCLIDALQAIVNTSGFGSVMITPKGKIKSRTDVRHFEVHSVISFRIRVMPSP
jgi:hypothetical protein